MGWLTAMQSRQDTSYHLDNQLFFVDSCLECTNGTTGLVPDYLVDCAGTCNQSRIDSCGVCQVIGFETPRDCNNDCAGTAIINECDACVLGNTNKTEDFGKIRC